MDTRNQVKSAQQRMKETVHTLTVETAKAHVATVRELAAKRDELLTAGPVKVARAALEVRQERLRRLQVKAVDTKRKRDARTTGAAALLDPEDEEPVATAGRSASTAAGTAPNDPFTAHVGRLPKQSGLLS
jgi:hypothetical protein